MAEEEFAGHARPPGGRVDVDQGAGEGEEVHEERAPQKKTPARRAEFIQPGVSTPGGRRPKDPQAPEGWQVFADRAPAEVSALRDSGKPAVCLPGVDTPGWINSALRA